MQNEPSPNALPVLCDQTEINSLREWLATWGDTSKLPGETVPIAKTTLARLLDTADYSWERFDDLMQRDKEPF